MMCQVGRPKTFASFEVWMVSKLSNRISIPAPMFRYGYIRILQDNRMIPSTVRKIPQARLYWNARQ